MSSWLALVLAVVVGALVHPPRPLIADRCHETAIATEASDIDIDAAPRDPLARGAERLGSSDRRLVGVDDDDSLGAATGTVFALSVAAVPLVGVRREFVALERRPSAVLPRGPPA